ncbi:MAG: DUF3619 family protein [Betaproteobacteria bacterium]
MSPTLPRHHEALVDRQGLRLAARLNEGSAQLPHSIAERLRAGREQALARRKVASPQTVRGLSLALASGPEEGMGWFGRMGSLMALCLLVIGLLGIHEIQNELRARELAEVDLALLLDDLPPAAFADPGFMQFLKSADSE